MRARNIKPGFYKNEDLAECSCWARLLFPGLWMLADREGRLEDRPKRIKGELFAYDSIDVEPLLRELEARKFLLRYEIDGERYIQILGFKAHQSPHYSEKPSAIKAPSLPEKQADMEPPNSGSESGIKKPEIAEHSGKVTPIKRGSQPPDSLIPDSPNPESRKTKAADAAVAFALPDWVPVDDWRAFDEHRRKAKKPMTERAKQLVVIELDKLRKAGHAPSAVLQQSVRRGWLDVFPLKADQLPLAPGQQGPNWARSGL
jgi:hypothetical protein